MNDLITLSPEHSRQIRTLAFLAGVTPQFIADDLMSPSCGNAIETLILTLNDGNEKAAERLDSVLQDLSGDGIKSYEATWDDLHQYAEALR